MKTHPVLIAAALVAGFAFAHAQEPAALGGLPAQSGTAAPLPGLFPPAPSAPGLMVAPAAATPVALPADATSGTSNGIPVPAALSKGSAEQLRQAVRIRELKTQVLEDPQVQAQMEGAQCAVTYAGQRVWMRNYYTLLYTKMEKIDPSLSVELESQLKHLLERYEQRQVRPSVLIECVKELPGSHSADHVSLDEKPEKSKEKSSKEKHSRGPIS